MPSSTSSSDAGAIRSLGRTWLAALLATALLVGAVELAWRRQGQVPHVVDDTRLWCHWRGRATGDHTVALVGASRMRLGLSMDVIREMAPGRDVVQLSIDGSSGVPVLHDLARDERFSGTVIAGIAEFQFLPVYYPRQQEAIDFCDRRWGVKEAVGAHLSWWLQRRLVTAQPGLSLRSILSLWRRSMAAGQPRLFPGVEYVISRDDRSARAHFSRVDVSRVSAAGVDLRRRIHAAVQAANVTPEAWLRWALVVEPMVEEIRARGGQVAFVRLPTSGEWLALDDEDFPRSLYWDRFAEATSAVTVHFQDMPGWGEVELPDGSHLDGRDVPRFTRDLVSTLAAAGVIEGCEGCADAAAASAAPPERAPEEGRLPSPTATCARDRDCPRETLCVAGRCDPVQWPPGARCEARRSGCARLTFPDPCYEGTVGSDVCPSRTGELAHPARVPFLELGAAGAADDAAVLRRLHDLWKAGRSQSPPTRPRVLLAVGDSISATTAYLTDDVRRCAVPDFPFDAGYRLVGQRGVYDVTSTAVSGKTAAWGREVLSGDAWWEEVRPEVATISFGTNELGGSEDSLETFAQGTRAMADRLLSKGVIPILVTPPPVLFRSHEIRQVCGRRIVAPEGGGYRIEHFIEVVRQVAAERSLPLVDVHARFVAFDRPQGTAEVRRDLDICRDGSDESSCDPARWWATLMGDAVHPCARRCPAGTDVGGMDVRTDAILRMYKYLERFAMGRCRGSDPPPRPEGYEWDGADPVGSMRAQPDRSYCPDPVFSADDG